MKLNPSIGLQAKIQSVPASNQFTSSITLGELTFGARKKGSVKLFKKIQLIVTANLPVLSFDSEAAIRYGEVRAALERQGTPIGDADIRIASIALVRGLTVVSRNIKHFQRVPGLSVENWL